MVILYYMLKLISNGLIVIVMEFLLIVIMIMIQKTVKHMAQYIIGLQWQILVV